MTKREKKVIGGILAELFESGGSDALIEVYHCGADWLPEEAQHALLDNTELGEEIEEFMNIDLAKKFAKYAGGKFVPRA